MKKFVLGGAKLAIWNKKKETFRFLFYIVLIFSLQF